MFLCIACDLLKDSDDGCREDKSRGHNLICIDCINEEPEEEHVTTDRGGFSADQQALIDKWEAEADDEG